MYKQCIIQFVKSGAISIIWVAVKQAIQDSIIDVDYKSFNIKGKAVVLTVYEGLTIK